MTEHPADKRVQADIDKLGFKEALRLGPPYHPQYDVDLCSRWHKLVAEIALERVSDQFKDPQSAQGEDG